MKQLLFSMLFVCFLVYSGFVYTTGTEVTQVKPNGGAIQGKLVFQKYNCTACHQIYGLGGFLGPDLTSVLEQGGNRETYIRAILKSGTQRMPNFRLSDEEINGLIDYLKFVNETNNSAAR